MDCGSSRRCYLQNTHRKDYLKQIKLLFARMKACGWTPKLPKELMIKAAVSFEFPKSASVAGELENNAKDDKLFIHILLQPKSICM